MDWALSTRIRATTSATNTSNAIEPTKAIGNMMDVGMMGARAIEKKE